MLERLLEIKGGASLVLSPPATEQLRTAGVSALLESWFTPEERGLHGLPTVLVERLELLRSGRRGASSWQDTWVREGLERSLRVTFVPLPEQGGAPLWGLLLQEVSHGVPVPSAWCRRLTTREVEVLGCVLRGWDNQIIAEHLRCTVGTVKKHLQRIFDKLGVSSRAALLHLATRH
jgi:DNA-binding NarL/FixJ family response regulator